MFAVLSPLIDADVGRHRTISVRGLLVASQLNALARHHRAHVVEVARIVDGTDVETWGALHGDATTVQLDGEAAETQLMDDGTVPKP